MTADDAILVDAAFTFREIKESEFTELVKAIRADRKELQMRIIQRPLGVRITVYLVDDDPICAAQTGINGFGLSYFRRVP